MRSWEDKMNSSVPGLFWPAVSGLSVPSFRRCSRPSLGALRVRRPTRERGMFPEGKGADKSSFSVVLGLVTPWSRVFLQVSPDSASRDLSGLG